MSKKKDFCGGDMLRYRIYKKGNYYGINDDVCEFAVISCIRTEIEAEWLCDLLNRLHDENISQQIVIKNYQDRNEKLFKENIELKKFQNKILKCVLDINS